MKLTNTQIYNHAQKLHRVFQDPSLYLPARVNFYIQKNKSTIITLGEEIDKARMAIFEHYGEPTEDGMINVPPERVADAQKELNELFEIE